MSRLQPRRFAQSCMNAKSMRVLLQTKGKPPQHTLAEVLQPRLHIRAELSSGPVQPAPLGVLRNEEWSPLDVLGSPRTRGAAPKDIDMYNTRACMLHTLSSPKRLITWSHPPPQEGPGDRAKRLT